VVLALPLHRFGEIDPALLNGKLVVDAMNYWPAAEGVLGAFSRGGSSEIVARRLARSTVVKAQLARQPKSPPPKSPPPKSPPPKSPPPKSPPP
jgi:hypothetical protein